MNRDELPDDRGWWGYSFRDVPNRISGESFMATLPHCSVVPCINPDDNQFWVAILNDDERSLEMDQISFQSWHADVLETDRFRPELLQSVRKAFSDSVTDKPQRRIYISRARAARRKLLNEKDVWPLLEEMGFEKVFMEELNFSEQVKLMQQSDIVVAPHGAAITNVLFCQPGTHVVEIADLSFPNPNFYALASAMGHHYWILNAEGVGDVHPLEKDLRIDPSIVSSTVQKALSY